MMERFTQRNKDIVDGNHVKDRVKKFFKTHKDEVIKDHLPLAATIVSLGIAGAKKDARIGAISTALYLGYDKTKDKVYEALDNRREKKARDQAFNNLPEYIKTDVQQSPYIFDLLSGVDSSNEEFNRSVMPEDELDFEMEEEHSEEEQFTFTLPPQYANDFMDGILMSRYLLSAKLAQENKQLPEISQNVINSYNRDLSNKLDDYNGFVDGYFDMELENTIENRDIVEQTKNVMTYYGVKEQPFLHGALYFTGIYESQTEINHLKHIYENSPDK